MHWTSHALADRLPPAADRTLHACLRRATAALRAGQHTDGSWRFATDIGPVGPGALTIVERLFDALDPSEVGPALRYFQRQQRDDGSFAPHPGAHSGCVSTTALCWAAVHALGVPREHDIAARAHRFVERGGGLTEVCRALARRRDPAALFLIASGHLDADFLPRLAPAVFLAGHRRALEGRTHGGNLMMLLVLAAVAERHCPAGAPFDAAGRALGWIGIADELCRRQDADGSWGGCLLQTTLVLLGLHAVGMIAADEPIRHALAWLATLKHRRVDELSVASMDNDVRSTALCTLALHAVGEPPDGPVMRPAIDHLLSTQTRTPMPRENQRKLGATRTGGWASHRGAASRPNVDDTATVIAVLSRVAAGRARGAVDDGVTWLRDMQNPDGGFPTFAWGLRSKAPGPMFTTELTTPLYDPDALVRSFFDPPPEYGDPALEGVTGRVLWGLGSAGVQRDDPAVRGAIAFLRAQQGDDGSWWGRWRTCYLAETATVLVGLAAAGEHTTQPYVRLAVDWMLSCQNEDGGFGESAQAYVSQTHAGCGPSTAAVTAQVLLGLIAADHGRSAAAREAAQWLVAHQDPSGSWPNGGWLHTLLPPDRFYTYDAPAQALPVIALAEFAMETGS